MRKGTRKRSIREEEKPTMRWFAQDQAYYGSTTTGRTIRVAQSAYKQAEQDEIWPSVLQDPDAWAMFVGTIPGVAFEEE